MLSKSLLGENDCTLEQEEPISEDLRIESLISLLHTSCVKLLYSISSGSPIIIKSLEQVFSCFEHYQDNLKKIEKLLITLSRENIDQIGLVDALKNEIQNNPIPENSSSVFEATSYSLQKKYIFFLKRIRSLDKDLPNVKKIQRGNVKRFLDILPNIAPTESWMHYTERGSSLSHYLPLVSVEILASVSFLNNSETKKNRVVLLESLGIIRKFAHQDGMKKYNDTKRIAPWVAVIQNKYCLNNQRNEITIHWDLIPEIFKKKFLESNYSEISEYFKTDKIKWEEKERAEKGSASAAFISFRNSVSVERIQTVDPSQFGYIQSYGKPPVENPSTPEERDFIPEEASLFSKSLAIKISEYIQNIEDLATALENIEESETDGLNEFVKIVTSELLTEFSDHCIEISDLEKLVRKVLKEMKSLG